MNLKEIQSPVKNLLAETNAYLSRNLTSSVQLLTRMIELTPITKGKKIRSTLLFLLAGMTGSFPPELVEIAASVEMFHLSSLIHDDVLDNSQQRRGEKTLHSNMGNFRSVMGGDYLFINSFAGIHHTGRSFLLDIVLKAAQLMVEGQVIEVDNANNFDLPLETYYDIIDRKTSSLFAAVAEMVSALNGDSMERRQEFYQFGLNFGTIFQVSDDMLDIFSSRSGKDRFRDMEEGKVTLPFILLMGECKEDIKADFLNGNHQRLLKLFQEYNTKALCLEQVSDFYNHCVNFINPFPHSIYKESLLKLLDFIKYRDY